MSETHRPGGTHTLWGTPHSLYTGKIRSYLIKKGIAYRELFPPHPRFREVIRPALRLMVAPVIETPDGEILQDTAEMIEHFEQYLPEPQMIPATPVQRVVARLLDAFGSNGLLPAAMSYRWSYRAEQEQFLRAEFGRGVHAGPDREARRAAGLKLMNYFNDFLPHLGVRDDTQPAIEHAYLELLEALDIHFQHFPYLLGGRPSIADTGLMGPLYAHLARDPVPATLMKNHAPNVYRWTERMNRAAIADGEFPDCAESYFADDAIAPTLEPVLRLMFRDWGPELLANAHCYESWLEANPGLPAGQLVAANGQRAVHPSLGAIEYRLGDCTVRRSSSPYSLWHFQRAIEDADALDAQARKRLAGLLVATGGAQVMQIRLSRSMRRADFVLVLG